LSRLQQALSGHAAAVERLLQDLLPSAKGPRGKVVDAMRYGALFGGKRLRPFLLIESAALFGVSGEQSCRAAAALEMVHCYSLIHDDLPAMDDSDLRRGRATVHKEFGDAVAILAGDGLLTEAFAVLADPACHTDSAVRSALVAGLAAAAGSGGMVGGQMIDISPERSDLDLQGIKELQRLKTGAMIEYACDAGAILGMAGGKERKALRSYAADLGLAFQIADDLLDVLATPEELGKPTGQDTNLERATFVGRLGVEAAQAEAQRLVGRARERLDIFGEKADLLRDVAGFVIERRS